VASWRTVRTRLLLVLSALAALTLAVVADVFVFPSTHQGPPGDAVVVLAGDPPSRLPVGVGLAEGGTGILILSAPAGRHNYSQTRGLCDDPGDLTVYCFSPATVSTQGEARALRDLVDEHGWGRITVVTSTYHVHRARLLIERCTGAQVQMVAAPPSISPARWVDLVAHELGGTIKATVDWNC
jgi:hypothetical protein